MSDEIKASALALLERLMAFETQSDKTNLPLIDFVEDYLRGLGVPVLRAPNPAGDKAALLATIGPMIDGGIVLSGHTDVVPPEGQKWTSDPFALRSADGRLYGRGSCDMKGFDAIALAMVPSFKAAQLRRPIQILLSYDEETSCEGSLDFIRRFGKDVPRPGAVIVGEPTMMEVADAHKSIGSMRVSIRPIRRFTSARSMAERRATYWRANACFIGSFAAFRANRPWRLCASSRLISRMSRCRASRASSPARRSRQRSKRTCPASRRSPAPRPKRLR
jgi:acetylornithine deacetylase/succinyl-diaminopimelate desuccinylase-like protein